MTETQIQRIIDDITDTISMGKVALDDEDKGYPYVAGYYGSLLQEIKSKLLQDLKCNRSNNEL
mgnify:CR=1 FL=1